MATIDVGAISGLDWSDLTVAGIGLMGVLIGGLIQIGGSEVAAARQARLQRQAERRDRGLSALALAEHLEGYVLECRDVIATFWDVDWLTPYQPQSNATDGPYFGKPIAPWPDLVDWRLLGLPLAVKAAAFRRRTELTHDRLDASGRAVSGEDLHASSADAAALLALDAWELAVRVRHENNLDVFDHEEWPVMDAIAKHRQRRAEIERDLRS